MIGNYAKVIDDKALSVLSQVKKQATHVQIKKILGLLVFEKIQKLFIQLVVGMHIAFIIIKNLAFLVLPRTFSTMLVV